ncbi:MAG: hypothetical protein R3C42_09065 [Parvularculaceae bacterium]
MRATAKAGKPQVGIRFGHQLMARAFGGEVKIGQAGGVGVHRYDVAADAVLDDAEMQGKISCAVSHQDHGYRAAAGREGHRRFAVLRVRAPVLCARACDLFPDAPEFEHDFATDLIGVRRNRFGDELSDEGLSS